jgi:SET domain-containing protein
MTKLMRWKSRWVTPKSNPLLRSKIHGIGVQAIASIAKGETVAVLGGIIVPSEDLNDYKNEIGDYGIQINDRFYICPFSEEDAKEMGVFNHSCEPNLGLIDSITFVAIKDIEANDELTFDYAMTETRGLSMECNCGSISCRKRIEPTDWKRSYLQKKYGKYFSPYIKNKRGFRGNR